MPSWHPPNLGAYRHREKEPDMDSASQPLRIFQAVKQTPAGWSEATLFYLASFEGKGKKAV
jgi:hypothetical protein